MFYRQLLGLVHQLKSHKNQLLNNEHLVLCRHYIYRGIPSTTKKFKIKGKDDKEEHRSQSLIAQNLFKSEQEMPSEETSIDFMKEMSLKLKNFTRDSRSDHGSKEENNYSFSDEMIANVKLKDKSPFSSVEVQDHFVENMVFKDDMISNQIKPSPLLGTEDQSVPPSNVPCVGCGALLHCQHSTLPGFLPSERFKLLSESELRSSICQRCYYIQHCDAFVEVTSTPEDYAKIIKHIKPTRSVVVMVIDVMDIRGSIIPNLSTYIGHKHPLVVVGNKADLIAPDSSDYLKKTREAITQSCHDAGLRNIRKVTLISAKTGYGIERLISTLFSLYELKVDVYIVGTANSGKSTLFNQLLASDYCRTKARSLIERATVSVWPGTTLNLLKFPIMRATPRVLALRNKRLTQEKAIKKYQEKLHKEQRKQSEKPERWELKEDISATDLRTQTQVEKDITGKPWGQEVFAYKGSRNGGIKALNFHHFSPETFDSSLYTHSYWVYDTPGVINTNQIFNMLKPEECPLLQPLTKITPRCVVLKPGTTIYISGMARLDYVEGTEAMMTTVHCASNLPLRVVVTEEADEYYMQHIGTPELGIPLGDEQRLNGLPALVAKEIELQGKDDSKAVADIQLSSIGWISVAPRPDCTVKMRAYTPGRRGIHVRCPSLIPSFKPFKGKRVSGTPFFWSKIAGFTKFGQQLPSDGSEVS